MNTYRLTAHLLLGCVFLSFLELRAQAPYVNMVSKNSAAAQESITIQGINFGTSPSTTKVVFGSVAATPDIISDQLIEVKVPYGTAYDNLSVVNTSTGMTGFFKDPFFLNHGGSSAFESSQLASEVAFNSESGLYDLTIADFDGDTKLDVATANDNSTNISVFLNTGTPGNVNFTKSVLAVGTKTLHVSSGDLNGDAKPEILVSEVNGSRIFIYKNNSTPGSLSFSQQNVVLTGAKVSQIRIIDLDLNGKPELIVTDQSTSRVFVVPNQSTTTNIQFSTPKGIALTAGTTSVDGIAVGDLDGDNLPEVVISEFLSPVGKMYILKNAASPGTLEFAPTKEIQASTAISNLRIGDLDGDGKPEIAATGLLASSVLIFANQSTSSALQFAAAKLFEVSAKPWGIDFGDLDGDGKTDLAVSSITEKSVTVLTNQSTVGNFAFTKQSKTTNFINRHIRIGDMDNDGRPDVSFTSIDDNSLGIPSSKVSIFLNKNCILPKLSPNTPTTICSGTTYKLNATSNPGGNYEWFKDGASMGAPSTDPFLNVSATGAYSVSLVNGSCSKKSTEVTVTVITAAPLGTATATPVSPVCLGGTLNLSVNDVGADSYEWTGPGAFSAQGLSVSRSNFVADQAGKYTVSVKVGSCIAQQASVTVDVLSIPGAEVLFSGSDIICEGSTKVFSFFPAVTGYTYQWAEKTSGDIAGATSASFTASSTGEYFLKLTSTTNTTCPPLSTEAKRVRVAKLPVVEFDAPAKACVNLGANFKDQSTLDSDPNDPVVNYLWDFGDGGSSTSANVEHIFTKVQNFNVKLSVSYRDGSCPASKTKSITVQSAPTVAIINPKNLFSFCPKDSVMLQVSSVFDSYLWSTGETTPSIYAKVDNTFSVEVVSGACKATATKAVTQYPETTVTVSAEPASFTSGNSTQLAASGLDSYLWRPNKDVLVDSLNANPVAVPEVTTLFTVTGKDSNGCLGEGSIEVIVIPDAAINILHPSKFFSPNGDGINDQWEVENAPGQSQCEITIYDENGIRVYEAKPYLNDWDGLSSKGKQLPAGVYYYVIRCDDTPKRNLAGSINIVR